MNLLEHYIVNVYEVKDITDEFIANGCVAHETVYVVDLTCDCYGVVTRTKFTVLKSQWEEIQKKGYFMA